MKEILEKLSRQSGEVSSEDISRAVGIIMEGKATQAQVSTRPPNICWPFLVCLFVCLFVSLFVCLFVFLSVCQSDFWVQLLL